MAMEVAKSEKRGRVVAALDIGTTKVAAAIGVINKNGVEVIGVGQAANAGMRQGVVVNIEATSESIIKAKEEAELMAGHRMEYVWLSVGGNHIQSFASSGMVAIRHKEVKQEDIDRVIEAAKAVVIPQDRQVLHVLPQDFKIDGQTGIFDPIGMAGVRLEASVFIITGSQLTIKRRNARLAPALRSKALSYNSSLPLWECSARTRKAWVFPSSMSAAAQATSSRFCTGVSCTPD